MLIGVRAHDYGRGTPGDLARMIGADGWQCAQIAVQKLISGFNRLDDVTPEILDEIYAAFMAEGVETPILGYYIDPANADKDFRMKQVGLFCEGLSLSSHLGGAYVASETGGFRGSEAERRPLFENLVDSVLRFAEHAEKTGSLIAIEPATDHTLGNAELVCELLRRVDSERLQLIFDPVNLLRKDIVENQPDYWNMIFGMWGERIKAFHVKDVKFTGGRFERCILGEGIIDFETIFGWMNKNKPDIPLFREHVYVSHAGVEFGFMKAQIKA